MFKKKGWRKPASDVVSLHQEQAFSATIFLLRTYGPTSFLLREDGQGSNFKVFLGQPHSCTCSVFVREQEPCKHICWVLLKKFRLPKDHEYSFQCGLSERQISEVLHGSHQIQQTQPPTTTTVAEGLSRQRSAGVHQRDIQPQDVCPICQDELLERRQPVAYCRLSCGNSVHLSCMKVLVVHQRRSETDLVMVKCPLCREDFCSVQSLWEQVKNAAKLFTAAEKERPDKHLGVPCYKCRVFPISGKCFRCTVCTCVYFCESCSKRCCHPSHPLAVRSNRTDEWHLVSKGSSEVNNKDLCAFLSPEPLHHSVLAQMPGVQVRLGSQLLLDGMQCRLCLQSFTLGQRVQVLPCNHKFHSECVDPILQMINACPLDGYVFYNLETRRSCDRKSTSKLACPNTRDSAKQPSENSFHDLFVPGVALQPKKQQLEVPSNSPHLKYHSADLSLALTTTHSGKAPSSVKNAPSPAAVNATEQAHLNLCVGVLSDPKPHAKVSLCRRVRAQPKKRSTVNTAVPSQLTVTGIVQAPRDMM